MLKQSRIQGEAGWANWGSFSHMQVVFAASLAWPKAIDHAFVTRKPFEAMLRSQCGERLDLRESFLLDRPTLDWLEPRQRGMLSKDGEKYRV